MKVTMRVIYDTHDILEAMKACYVAQFGQPADGFELDAKDQYGSIKVESVEKTAPDVEPAMPEKEVSQL